MTTRTLRALLWKDFRINRMLLIVGAVLWVLPYVFILVIEAVYPSYSSPRYASLVQQGCYGSIGASMLTVAMLAGNALSAERVTRSAAFLAYLPPSRAAVFVSKGISAITPCVLIFGVNLLVLVILYATGLSPHVGRDRGSLVRIITVIPAAGVSIFGVAWVAGFLLKSPAIACCLGVGTPLVLIMAVEYYVTGDYAYTVPVRANCITALTVGVLGFVVGTFCYLRANPDV